MENLNRFSNEYDSINEGIEQLLKLFPSLSKWVPKMFKNKNWRNIIGLEEFVTKRALTQTEKNKLLQSIQGIKDDEFINDLIDSTSISGDNLFILSRKGNPIDIKYILSIIEMNNKKKLDNALLERFIKLLPERFPNGELCASRFRKMMGGNVKNVPKFVVTKGIKFSPQEDTKVLRIIRDIENHWDDSTWSYEEQNVKGFKEIKTELSISVDDVITPQSKYSKGEVWFRIWNNDAYCAATGYQQVTEYGNCVTSNVNGKTIRIINIFPENHQSKPNTKSLKNLFYHEITHAKDPGLTKSKTGKYWDDYKSKPDFEMSDGSKWYYTRKRLRGKKGRKKMVMKEWDYYKNYFVHTIENKPRFRASLEDMRFNANEWLTNRIKQYKDVGWDGIESRKRGMQDTIKWLNSVKNFLRSSGEYMDGKNWNKISKEGQDSMKNFWQLVSNYSVEDSNYHWLESLKRDNPKGFKEYSKKLATQIDDWIQKLTPQAFENNKYKYLIEFKLF